MFCSRSLLRGLVKFVGLLAVCTGLDDGKNAGVDELEEELISGAFRLRIPF